MKENIIIDTTEIRKMIKEYYMPTNWTTLKQMDKSLER